MATETEYNSVKDDIISRYRSLSEEEKDRFRDMCIEQDTWTKEHQDQILEYCLNDVKMGEDVFLGVVKDLETICGNDYETLLEQAIARGQHVLLNVKRMEFQLTIKLLLRSMHFGQM